MSTFKLPTPSPTLPRNGFDLSTRRVFTAPAGALLPVLTQEVNPGEHFSISVQDLVRTQPLNTAAFARCKEYYHFFFVPYKALWSSSDRFFTGVTNGDSTYLKPADIKLVNNVDVKDNSVYNKPPKEAPYFDLYRFMHNISHFEQKYNGKSLTNDSFSPNFFDIVPSDYQEDDRDPNIADSGNDPDHLAMDPSGSFPQPNYKPYKDIEKRLDPKDDPRKDVFGYSFGYGAFRLLNMLEYGVSQDGSICYSVGNGDNSRLAYLHFPISRGWLSVLNDNGLSSYHVSAFRPLAYQRIYNDFYRNHQWEKADPLCFNVDYLFNGGKIDDVTLRNMFTMRYRYLSKDWLTSALPTVNYSDGIFDLPSYVGSQCDVVSDKDSTVLENDGGRFISVSDIKAAFALDKMLEATRRANGLDYSSQIAAHYGFKVPDSRRPCAQFIGGFDNTIAISEVISTASGSTDAKGNNASVPGQLFGKGIGSMSSNKIDFDVKEHGIIMCIYSIAPQVDYNNNFMSPFNRKLDRMDYFQPEFQNLGLQPIMQSDLCFTADSKINNSILGYTSRYAEYKSNRDLVLGEFETGKTLSAWVTPRKSTFSVASDSKGSYLSLGNFMVNPNVLDPIFSVNYNGTPMTDQFMVNSYFDIKAVRPMSVVGSINL